MGIGERREAVVITYHELMSLEDVSEREFLTLTEEDVGTRYRRRVPRGNGFVHFVGTVTAFDAHPAHLGIRWNLAVDALGYAYGEGEREVEPKIVASTGRPRFRRYRARER